MKRWRTRGHKILTIIVGGIIVGILAAIAVPLYTGYVERARVTEASSIMGTIITSQKVEKQRTGKYYSASTIAEFKSRRIPLDEPKFFTYETTPTPNGGFIVTATPTDAFGPAGGSMTYRHDPTKTPPGSWDIDEMEILKDFLPLQT